MRTACLERRRQVFVLREVDPGNGVFVHCSWDHRLREGYRRPTLVQEERPGPAAGTGHRPALIRPHAGVSRFASMKSSSSARNVFNHVHVFQVRSPTFRGSGLSTRTPVSATPAITTT